MDNSADYVLLVTGRVSRVIEGIGCQRFIDLHPAPIREYLAALGVEPKTKNHYIVALVGFVNWMIQARRAAVSPLRGLLRFKVREAARRRRALTEEEFARLLKAAAATDGRTMTGVARAALYCLAASTGYRAGELRSMVAANFTLDADPPRVSCRAGCTKSNREDSLPITPALADMLRPHVAAATTGPVFKMPRETWKLMRNDLRAAGIPQIDGLGRIYDFHSLRVQLAVDMHRGGLHDIKARQLRMRHANSAMTLDTYTRLGIGEGESEALAALPDRAAG